ncbi:MAG: aspartate-semialdehyde dehydrogenase, partial [Candidatus Bathycorpusculaceae bacterium]
MKKKVAILGATGAVGQRFIQLLQGHPWFEIDVLAASGRSAGKKYRTCDWILEAEMPQDIADMEVVNSDLESVKKAGSVDFVFSALPSDVAGSIEEEFAKEYPVLSKASAHRLEEDVPLLIPEVNPEHLELIKIQKKRR